MLRFPFAEDDLVADAGPLDGMDAFLAFDPAIARGRVKVGWRTGGQGSMMTRKMARNALNADIDKK